MQFHPDRSARPADVKPSLYALHPSWAVLVRLEPLGCPKRPPKSFQEVSKAPPRLPKRRRRPPQEASRPAPTSQEMLFVRFYCFYAPKILFNIPTNPHPNCFPRRLQDVQKNSRDTPKSAQDVPKRSPDASKTPPNQPRRSQEVSRLIPDC